MYESESIKLKNGMHSWFEYEDKKIDWCFSNKSDYFYTNFRLDLTSSKLISRILNEISKRDMQNINDPERTISIDLSTMKLHIDFGHIPLITLTFNSNDLNYYFDFHLTQKECVKILKDLKKCINVMEEDEWREVRHKWIHPDEEGI